MFVSSKCVYLIPGQLPLGKKRRDSGRTQCKNVLGRTNDLLKIGAQSPLAHAKDDSQWTDTKLVCCGIRS